MFLHFRYSIAHKFQILKEELAGKSCLGWCESCTLTNCQFNQNLADEDKERLLNMNIFQSVTIATKGSIYYVEVKEKKLIIYAPLIRKEDGIGWSAGPIINFNNIYGTARNIYFSSSFGRTNCFLGN